MTTAEINRAIAGWLGWKYNPPPIGGASVNPWQRPDGSYAAKVPNYHGDLNVMHEVEKGLVATKQDQFAMELRRVLGFHQHSYFDLAHATAAQRAEALLRTIGKWREDVR